MIRRPIDEHWLPIQGFEGLYEISDYGRVRSLKRITKTCHNAVQWRKERILKSASNGAYRFVWLGYNPKHRIYIHILVCSHFVGSKPSNKHEVNHRDGDKQNNFYHNLEWVTRSQNHRHAYALGLAKPRKTHPDTIKRIKALLAQPYQSNYPQAKGYTAIAKAVGVHIATVRAIDRGLLQ